MSAEDLPPEPAPDAPPPEAAAPPAEPVSLEAWAASLNARLTALAERGRQAGNAARELNDRAKEIFAVRKTFEPIGNLTAGVVVEAARRAWEKSLLTEAALVAEGEALGYDLALRQELAAAWARAWLVCEKTTVTPADGWFTAMAEGRDRVRAWGNEVRERLAAAERRWRPDAPPKEAP